MATKRTEAPSAFFGRRKGKALRDRQASLLSGLLPKIRPTDAQLSARDKRIWLEIGFGGGEHLTALASSFSDVQFIGSEPFINGVAKALSSINAHHLENVLVHDEEVSTLLARLPTSSVDRVYILYPDPWPKSRHHKRRLISDEFLERLARVMKPGAELRFATDIDDYSAWTLARVRRSLNFRWTQKTPTQWTLPWEDWAPTRYEQKAIKEERSPVYLIFERT